MLTKVTAKRYRLIASFLVICVLFTTAISALEIREIFELDNISWQDKISDELWEVMDKASVDELIPVWLWLRDIDDDVIASAMIREKGLYPAVYEDENRFFSEVVTEVARQIEERVGYREAHIVV